MSKIFKWPSIVATALLFVLAVAAVVGWRIANVRGSGGATQPFRFSEETTYLVEPRTSDGLVDYVAALNQSLSDGVTPENNSMVLLSQAFGPEFVKAENRDRFYELLQIKEQSSEGNYFVFFDAYLKRELDITHDDADYRAYLSQHSQALDAPWQAHDFPIVAEWLDVNEEPLKMISEAVARPEAYFPVVLSGGDDNPGLVAAQNPHVQPSRMAAQALMIRAMLRVNEGEVAEAWEDVLTIYGLGDHLGRGGMVIDGFVAVAFEGMASEAVPILISHSNADSHQLRTWLEDWKSLPPPPVMADKIDRGGRYSYLDWTQRMATGLISGENAGRQNQTLRRAAAVQFADWDQIMRWGNRWHDRIVASASIDDPPKRRAALANVELELDEFIEQTGEVGWLEWIRNRRRTATELIAGTAFYATLPSSASAQAAEDRAAQQKQNALVALALEIHRLERGDYPNELAALVPKYLDHPPIDILTGQVLPYRRTEQGYVLYSAGERSGSDDLRVEMPPTFHHE